MPKANRTCYCCGRKYYYCPSCSGEKKDSRIYTMWDSELCMEIFNLLTNESFKKITTLECKKKLIELGVDENTVLKDSVRKHVDRVMSYKEVIKEVNNNVSEEETKLTKKANDTIIEVETVETAIHESAEKIELNIENVKKTKRTKKGSLKNKENSEVD